MSEVVEDALESERQRRVFQEFNVQQFWHQRASGPSRKVLIGATLAFADLGYYGASTREIANRAGMSATAIYIHFSSKEELFCHINETVHKAAHEQMVEADIPGGSPSERLRAVSLALATFHAQFSVMIRTIHYDLRVLTGERFERIAAVRRDIDALLRQILIAGMEIGEFKVSDLDGTSLMILSSSVDLGRWFRESEDRTPVSIGIQYSNLALKLVGAT